MTYDFPKQSVAQSKSFLRYIALRKIYPMHHIRCTREGLPGARRRVYLWGLRYTKGRSDRVVRERRSGHRLYRVHSLQHRIESLHQGVSRRYLQEGFPVTA